MPKPFNLDAFEPEETTEPFRFIFGGEEFTMPAHIDPRLQRRANQGDLDGVLRTMIGEEQYARLDKIEQPFDERQLGALLEAWSAHCQTTMGEVSASSSSSKSTGRLSKRTSNGSTGSSSQALSMVTDQHSTGDVSES